MYQLASAAPVEHELVPARGDRPAVVVTFSAQPSPLSLRAGRAAVAAVLRDGLPGGQERAGDAFSAALIRYNILGWSGIGDADDVALEPTHDREIRDADGALVATEPGTISLFLAEPRLFEAADEKYVLPWALADAEKNGFAPSSNGISAGATADSDTATTPATQAVSADATPAPTGRTKRERTPEKASGA